MGPQSFDCGKGAVGWICSRCAAASMGPQSFDCGKPPATALARSQRSGFNGAAVFRLRKVPWGEYHGGALVRLQWGRSLSTAERKPAAPFFDPQGGFNGAAVFRLRKALEDSVVRCDERASMGPQSFDCGKDSMPFPSRANTVSLQWGRSLSTAERANGAAPQQTVQHASMGPQSFDCGKHVAPSFRPNQ